MHKALVILGVALVAAACRDNPVTSPAAERAVIATQRQHLVLPVTDNGDGTATVVFQPGPGLNNGSDQGTIDGGQDTFIQVIGASSSGPAPASPWLMHFNSDCNARYAYSLYRFDVADLPPANLVVSAKLELYNFLFKFWLEPWPTLTTSFVLNEVVTPWNEATATWATRPTLGAELASVTVPTDTRHPYDGRPNSPWVWFDGWASMDITPQYAAWKNETAPNYGVAYRRVTQFCEAGSVATWTYTVSSDMLDVLPPPATIQGSAAWRPRLVVTYLLNRAPTVSLLPPAPPLVGAPVTLAAQASDADGDPLTFAWTIDGAPAGSTETIVYTFATAGTHTVTVTVSDGKAGGTATATANVAVLTAVQWMDAVRAMLNAAGLEKGLTNSLVKKLDNAAKSLEKGNANAASGQLGAFTNEIDAAMKTGRIPVALGNQLLAMANQLLATL